jgi:hypothetical protein
MTAAYQHYKISLISIIVVGTICLYQSNLNCRSGSGVTHEKHTIFEAVQRPPIQTTAASPNTYTSNKNSLDLGSDQEIISAINTNTAFITQKNKPAHINEILDDYYGGATTSYEERAFKRVLRWKKNFKDITEDYSHVTWEMLAAIVKAETQGKTGRQDKRSFFAYACLSFSPLAIFRDFIPIGINYQDGYFWG